jgi:hypothetical protein
MITNEHGFSFDPDRPLLRYPRESVKSNNALHDYYYTGLSLRGLVDQYKQGLNNPLAKKPPTLVYATIFTWSMTFSWAQRKKIQTEIDRKIEDDLWMKRRMEIKHKDYSQAEKLRELADRIITEAPKFTKATRRFLSGKRDAAGNQLEPDKEIITIALDGNLLINCLRTASELQRKAAGVDDRQINLDIDLNNLTDEQLEKIADGADILTVLSDASKGVADKTTAG